MRDGRTARTAPSTGSFPAAWSAWSQEVAGCRRCPLGESRTQVVLYRGAPHPRVAFVGEAPGRDEDRTGLPFVGRAGKRLDAGIAQVGLGPSEFGVLNVVKCRPPNNRLPRLAVVACRPFLDRQLAMLRPQVVVTLGAHALASLDPKAPAITAAAGQPRPGASWTLFPLVHPAATFRSRRYAARWDADLRRLGEWLHRAADSGRPPNLETL